MSWISSFCWMGLGREICQCQLFRDEDSCQSFKEEHKVECLESENGSRMVVKQFDKEELQTMYNPTPGRGLAFIRVVRGKESQEWRRNRRGEITVTDHDKTFHLGENTTRMCTASDKCTAKKVSVSIRDGKFLWLTY